MKNPRSLLFGLIAVGGLLAVSFTLMQGPPGGGGVEARDAWVRATAPGASVGAAYLKLENRSGQTVQLLPSAASSVSARVELHETRSDGGMMGMRHLDHALPIAPGQTADIKPGGLHLMLVGLQAPLKVGDQVQLALALADGRTLSVNAPVLDAAPQ